MKKNQTLRHGAVFDKQRVRSYNHQRDDKNEEIDKENALEGGEMVRRWRTCILQGSLDCTDGQKAGNKRGNQCSDDRELIAEIVEQGELCAGQRQRKI